MTGHEKALAHSALLLHNRVFARELGTSALLVVLVLSVSAHSYPDPAAAFKLPRGASCQIIFGYNQGSFLADFGC